MIAPDRALVRSLRRQVRTTVKASPQLRRDRKNARGLLRSRNYALTTLRFIVPLVIFVTAVNEMTTGLSHLLVVWTALVVLQRAAVLVAMYRSPDALWVFYQLPVSNSAVFAHMSRNIFRSSLWLGIDWLVFGLAVAVKHPAFLTFVAIPFLAAAQWSVGMVSAGAMARWFPRVPYGGIATVMFVVGYVLLQATKGTSLLVTFWAPALSAFSHATPAGWVASAYFDAITGGISGWLLLCGLGVGAAALIRQQIDPWRERFNLEDIFDYHLGESTVDAGVKWTPAETNSTAHVALPPAVPVVPVNETAIRDALIHYLEQPAGLSLFQRGFIERLITRLLTVRQRIVVDLMQPRGFGWTRGWLVALGAVLVARLWIATAHSEDEAVFVSLVGVALFAFPVFGSAWLTMGTQQVYGLRIALNSFSPVGYWEAARLLLWVATLRCLFGLPLLILAIRYGMFATPVPWAAATGWACRGTICVLTLQPIWVIGAFSQNSNDSSSKWWFTILIFLTILFGLIFLMGMGIALFVSDKTFPALADGAIMLGGMLAIMSFYGWAYNRDIFDLVAKPRPS